MKNLVEIIRIDEKKCNNCHKCISVCPVKFCIDGSGDTVVVNHNLCIGCGSCIDACSSNARTFIDDTEAAFTALDNREKLIVISAPALVSNFNTNYKNLIGWLKSRGVAAVFDVSFGAELTVRSYLEHVKTNKPKCVIAQPCPAIVSYIEIYKPELLNILAPADSPMLHTAKMIREFYPQYKNHKLIVLSPCIAKRREFADTGICDYNVTLAGLSRRIEEDGINLDRFEPAGFDNPPAERAALFSSPGGLMKTVMRENPAAGELIRKIEGPSEIYEYLDTLSESVRKGVSPLIVDCLNCSKGCNGGTGTLSRESSIDELEFYISKRTEEMKLKYRKPLSVKTSKRKLNRVLDKYWRAGLYGRTYQNRAENNTIRTPSKMEIEKIYTDMLKDTEADYLNCAACGYNSCERMAVAIFNGLNKKENCHRYKHRMVEIEKNVIDSMNQKLGDRISGCKDLILTVQDSLKIVDSNMLEQSGSLEESSGSVKQMIDSFSIISESFMKQNSNLKTLIVKARDGEYELKGSSGAIKKITSGISRIGEMVGMIDDISQRTNLLSMNAAIEAAHAGSSGKGFAVVAQEIKKLAENTAAKAKEVGETLNGIISEAGTTSSSSELTTRVILEIISEIHKLTTDVNKLAIDVEGMVLGSSSIISSIDVLKSDNRKVLDSAAEIGVHINQLDSNMQELITIASGYEEN
ncbi:MAG: 4Fe-4S binding protein [Spirochaetales bacterium]|nr:4Fe-4S binding protein [Spirochaetales bacterium]